MSKEEIHRQTCKNSVMENEREILTWEECGPATRSLARKVWESGYHPDVIVCVARGGLIPAGAIAYALDQKSVLVLNVEFYTGIGTTLRDPRLIDPVPIHEHMTGKKVLIVDDVADSGRTLAYVRDMCEAYASDVKIAVLYEKSRSIIDSDYVWKRTDKWIAFPWSSLPPVTETGQAEA